MKSTSLLLLFAFMISFYSDTEIKQFHFFPKNVQEECSQIISGKIINKKTNSPISNALITLYLDGQDIKIEKTNSQGEYSLKLNCDTNYRIEVSASNFFKVDFLIKTSSQNNTNLTHNFFLEYECYQTITGKVINELTKDIVHNATLTLYLDGEKIETQKVNDSGEYNFKIRCNTNYYIIADKTDYINDLYEFTSSTTDNENINHDFILEPECIQTISGTIRNKVTKEPLSAEIKLYLNNIEAETIKVNNDGSYFIKFQCTTNYRIIATKPNYIDDSYNFLTDYIEYKQPDYFHLKKDLFLEPNLCYQVVLGKVFDKKTNEVVTDALVSLLHQNNEITTFQTSYDGSYFFKIKCALDYELKVTKEGMLSKIINYKASAIKGDNKTQNIYIESEACNQIVNGSILDKETKLPLANTQVTLFENNNEVNKITTDNNGTFSFNIKCENTYKIVADNNEYNSNTITFETDKKRDISISKTLELTKLDCNQIVNGSILDKETKIPLANTQVTLFENNNEVNKITTDNNGTFSFNIKCENTYKIVADNNEYNSNTITFETDKKRDISISKTLELTKLDCNQIVNGSILDKETKLPLANTQVTLFENNNEVNKITTDNNGTFSFNIKCENTYKIVADNNEYNSNTITFETDKKRDISISKTLELTKLDCNQIVNGSILDKETKIPLANTQVTLFENNNEVNKITTDYKGAFSLNLNCNSNYKIVANNEEYNSDSVTLNTSKIRDVINNITINLSKKICSQTITGIIRDKTTKKPLPNTTISLYKDNEIVDTYTVGNDGIYLFKLECSANYKLTVFKNNYLESFKLKTSTLHNRTLTLHIDIEPSVCVQYINGIVRENITDNFIPNAKVILYNNSKEIEQTITDSNGSFYFEIECNKTYTVYTEKINYTKTQQNVISSGKSGYPHNIDLAIEPIINLKEKNGIKYIETNPILFELDEYKIIDGAKTELNKVIFNMHQNPAIKIEVNYHTDSRGPDDYNLELTINRANATKDYLVSKGIDPDRIIANGYGETRLLNNCKNNVKCSDAEHEINRRTEFIVIKN